MGCKLCRSLFWLTIFMILPVQSLLAADQKPATISWGFLIIGLLGGLALFLYGMDKRDLKRLNSPFHGGTAIFLFANPSSSSGLI